MLGTTPPEYIRRVAHLFGGVCDRRASKNRRPRESEMHYERPKRAQYGEYKSTIAGLEEGMDVDIALQVDGSRHTLTVDTRATLLDALRERLGITTVSYTHLTLPTNREV